MILLVDWGNTFLKTLIVEDDITEQSKLDSKHLYQSSSIEEFSEYILHVNTHPETKISTAYISSVRKTSDNQSLILILEQLEIDSKLTKTTRELSGVVCAYKQFESFGGDRWLAVIAAYSPKKTTGIIDIGSAITLD
ncbi:MAG: type III pantothenate kinase, partial [Kangiellaceae bacterium]